MIGLRTNENHKLKKHIETFYSSLKYLNNKVLYNFYYYYSSLLLTSFSTFNFDDSFLSSSAQSSSSSSSSTKFLLPFLTSKLCRGKFSNHNNILIKSEVKKVLLKNCNNNYYLTNCYVYRDVNAQPSLKKSEITDSSNL